MAEWEVANDRPFFWASKGRSSEAAVHLQGMLQEAAASDGMEAASVLTDLAKAYEYIRHYKLLPLAAGKSFPMRILRLCLKTYGGMRRVLLDGLTSELFVIGGATIVAGCTMATSLLKAFLLEMLD